MSEVIDIIRKNLKEYESSLNNVRMQTQNLRQQLSNIQAIIRQKEAEESQIYGQITALNAVLKDYDQPKESKTVSINKQPLPRNADETFENIEVEAEEVKT